MDLQKELDEIKGLLLDILEKKEPTPLTDEDYKKMREKSEASLLAHNNEETISPPIV